MKDKTYQRYDKNLLDRIDNMITDADYDPYASTKKRTVSDDELFNDKIYRSPDEEDYTDNIVNEVKDNGSISGTILGIVVGTIVVIAVAVAIILLLKA